MRIARPLFTTTLVLCLLLGGILPLANLHAQDNTITLQLTIPTTRSDVYTAKFLDEFESSHPGIKVQVNKLDLEIPQPAFDLDQHFEAVQKYVSSGDVVYTSATTISPEDTQAGYYLDLAPLVMADTTLTPNDFYPMIWQSYQWENGIWALPVSADPFVLMYSPGAFDKVGLAYPNDKWTIDDLIGAARQLSGKDADGKIEPGIDVLTYLQGFVFRAFLKNSLLDTSTIPNSPQFDSPALVSVMEKWLDLDQQGAIGLDLGKAPMSIGPATWLALGNPSVPEEKRLASMLPGGQAALSVNGFAVSAATLHPIQAYALAAWLTQRPDSSNIGTASTPARKSLRGTVGNDERTSRLIFTPEIQAIIDQAVANAIPLSEMRYADYLAVAYDKMKTDKLEPKAALQQAELLAVNAQQRAANKKETLKTAFVLATPIPPATTAAPDKVTLNFAVVTYAGSIPNWDAWNRLLADFTASNPDIGKIWVDGGVHSLGDLAASHDCFYLPYNGLAPENLGQLLPLNPFTSADPRFENADMLNGVITQVTRDTKIYALPVNIAPDVLKYDALAFEQAGIPAPGLVWTTNQFTDALKQLKMFNGGKPGVVLTVSLRRFITDLIVDYGGNPIDSRTTPPTISFTDPATIDAIRQVTDLAKNGYFTYNPLFTPQMNLGMTPPSTFIKPWTLSAYSSSNLRETGGNNDHFKLTLYPQGGQHTAVSYTLGTLYISAKTPNANACYRFISALAKNPTLFSSMPVRRTLLDDPTLLAAQGEDMVTLYKQIAKLMQDSKTIPIPAFGVGASLDENVAQMELYKALDAYLAPDSSGQLESLLKAAEANAQAFVNCSGTLPPLDIASADSQRAYDQAAKQCVLKADPDLAPFF